MGGGLSSALQSAIRRTGRPGRCRTARHRLRQVHRTAVTNSEGEYAIIPASVADKIAQRDASSIVLHSALSAEEQDEDDPYADFKVPDDLMW